MALWCGVEETGGLVVRDMWWCGDSGIVVWCGGDRTKRPEVNKHLQANFIETLYKPTIT